MAHGYIEKLQHPYVTSVSSDVHFYTFSLIYGTFESYMEVALWIFAIPVNSLSS